MTFMEWNDEQPEWWKSDTPETLEQHWDSLVVHGVPTENVAFLLDDIIGVIRGEYGG